MERRRVLAVLLSMSLLNGAIAPATLSAMTSQASASVEPADVLGSDLMEGLSEVLERTLSQTEGSEGLTLAVQGLELDTLDPTLPESQSRAAQALLRTVENPLMVQYMRAFILRQASKPGAANALALLRQWERLVSDSSHREALLAGLSGANDLASSIEGMPQAETETAAAVGGAPVSTQPAWLPIGRPSQGAAVAAGGPMISISFNKDVHSGLSPPSRAPPFQDLTNVSHLSRTLPKEAKTRKKKEEGKKPFLGTSVSLIVITPHLTFNQKEVL